MGHIVSPRDTLLSVRETVRQFRVWYVACRILLFPREQLTTAVSCSQVRCRRTYQVMGCDRRLAANILFMESFCPMCIYPCG